MNLDKRKAPPSCSRGVLEANTHRGNLSVSMGGEYSTVQRVNTIEQVNPSDPVYI